MARKIYVLWSEQYDKSDTDSDEEGKVMIQQMFSKEIDDDDDDCFWIYIAVFCVLYTGLTRGGVSGP